MKAFSAPKARGNGAEIESGSPRRPDRPGFTGAADCS